ncbi:MAG: GTPase HflX, partial [Natronospirillum sp.]
RQRSDTPTIALVGYTNAGKSTLFNALTEAGVYTANQLFATLDPTLRKLHVEDLGDTVLADTVGFIRHLPHKLVEAFKATLQETAEADLLLHVVDGAAEERDANIEQVNEVLSELGVAEKPILMVFNKADLLGKQAQIDYAEDGVTPARVWVSALTGDGFAELKIAIAERLGDNLFADTIVVPPKWSALRALLYNQDAVKTEQFDLDGNFVLAVRLQNKELRRMLSRCDIPPSAYLKEHREAF